MFGAAALAAAGGFWFEPSPARAQAEAARCRPSPSERGSPMCKVPAGEFWMGANRKIKDSCDDDEKPGRMVRMVEYYIDQHEVTVAEYKECVESGCCSPEGLNMPFWMGTEQPGTAWACNWGKLDRKDHPINCLSWEQARAYCSWAGKRLPSEAEWEKAARGVDGRIYPWGNQGIVSLGKKKKAVGNFADQTAQKKIPRGNAIKHYRDGYISTSPVESFPLGRSPFGLYDSIGNVWEWCSDGYDPDFHKNTPDKNPKGPASARYRTVRGGSWISKEETLRTSYRFGEWPPGRNANVGFRCAVSLHELTKQRPACK